MNAPDLFGVIVRTIGLCIGIYGLYASVWIFYPGEYAAMDYVVSSLPLMAIGLVLFLAANLIVTMAYPVYLPDEPDEDDKQQSESAPTP
jgi:hypothetical protein